MVMHVCNDKSSHGSEEYRKHVLNEKVTEMKAKKNRYEASAFNKNSHHFFPRL